MSVLRHGFSASEGLDIQAVVFTSMGMLKLCSGIGRVDCLQQSDTLYLIAPTNKGESCNRGESSSRPHEWTFALLEVSSMGCGIFAYKFTARHCTRCCKGARSSDMITQGPVLRALPGSTGGARDAHTNKWPDPLSGVCRWPASTEWQRQNGSHFLASQSY